MKAILPLALLLAASAVGSLAAASPPPFFADGFESGTANWTFSGNWGLTTSTSHSPTHSLTDTPSGNYTAYSDARATLAHSIDLSKAVAPVLKFWHRYDIAPGDFGFVEVSTDGGFNWTQVDLYSGKSPTWNEELINLSSYKKANFTVRFRLLADDDTYVRDGWYVDDVSIEEKDSLRISSLCDDFEGSLTNWTLSGNWGLTTSTSHSPTHSLTDTPSGNYTALSDARATLAHSIDLSKAVAPVLKFWQRYDIAPGDFGFVEVSTDGGFNWTRVDLYSGKSPTWNEEPIPLSAYKSADFKVRFRLLADDDTYVGDGWYIDDVCIEGLPPTCVNPPTAPALVAGSTTVKEGETLSANVRSTDPDAGQTITFSLLSAPAGMTILPSSGPSPLTGTITWTPTEAQGPGSYTVQVVATDNCSTPLSASTSFTFTVQEVNRSPQLTVPGPVEVYLGGTLQVSATATDPDLPANTLTLSLPGAPIGMTINPTTGSSPLTGQMTWTPSTAGKYTVTVEVTDHGTPALSTTKSFDVTVIGNTPPTITCIADQEVPPNGATSWLAFRVSDRETPANALVVNAESSNTNLAPVNRIFFYGEGEERYLLVMPTPGESGRATITLCVTDGGGLTTCCPPFQLVVCPGGPDIVQQPADQDAELGDQVTLTVRASAKGTLSYQWKHEGLDLPGATSDTLVLPSVTAADAGPYTVVVSDGVCAVTSAPAQLRLVPQLECEIYAVITVHGIPGHKYLLQYSESTGEPHDWKDLGWMVLEQSTQLFIDMTSSARTKRFYRAVRRP